MLLIKKLPLSLETNELVANPEIPLENIPTSVSLSNLKELEMLPIKDELNKKCLVTLYEGLPKIYDATCPHMGADLSMGLCTKTKIVCPWHGYIYQKKDGAFESNPNIKNMSNIRIESKNFNPELKVNYKLVKRNISVDNEIIKIKNDI